MADRDRRPKTSPPLPRYVDALEAHQSDTVLAQLPAGFRELIPPADRAASEEMVDKPKLDEFVFCKVRAEI